MMRQISSYMHVYQYKKTKLIHSLASMESVLIQNDLKSRPVHVAPCFNALHAEKFFMTLWSSGFYSKVSISRNSFRNTESVKQFGSKSGQTF